MNFANCAKKITKDFSLKPKTILQKLPKDLQNRVLTSLQEKVWQKPIHFCWMSDTDDRIYKVFMENQFSAKISIGLADCSLDYHVQSFFDTELKKVAQCPKVVQKKIIFISKRIFRLKLFLWTVKMHFWHSCQKIYDKNRFLPFKVGQWYKKWKISSKI